MSSSLKVMYTGLAFTFLAVATWTHEIQGIFNNICSFVYLFFLFQSDSLNSSHCSVLASRHVEKRFMMFNLTDNTCPSYATQVVAWYLLVQVSHSTLQHHTNLQRHLSSLTTWTVWCFNLQALQRERHFFTVVPSSLRHVLPNIPGEPSVLLNTQ